MINALAAFGLGYLFFKFVQDSNEAPPVEDSGQEETEEEEGSTYTPLTPTKDQFKLENVYERDGMVLYCLYSLQGRIYEENGEVIDNTEYKKAGFIVGDIGQTAFVSQNLERGSRDIEINGVQHENVSIFETEAAGKAYIDGKAEPDDDGPTGLPEDEPTPPPSPLPPVGLPGSGGSAFGEMKGFGGGY